MFSSANVVVNVTLCNLEHRYESSYFRQFISFANINSTTNSKSYSDVSKITLRFLFFAKKWHTLPHNHTLASFSLSHIHSIIYESKKNYSTTKKNYESKKKNCASVVKCWRIFMILACSQIKRFVCAKINWRKGQKIRSVVFYIALNWKKYLLFCV